MIFLEELRSISSSEIADCPALHLNLNELYFATVKQVCYVVYDEIHHAVTVTWPTSISCVTLIHKSSPVASWDRKVPIKYTLQNTDRTTLLEEKVLYRTLKGSISATYLEPLKGYIHS